MVLEIPERVVERVLTKVAMGPRGCHISTYSVASHGYAQVGWREGDDRVVTLCHRVVWSWFRGPIEPGMTVDHMCKNRRCVRLMHLRLIPNLENARRTSGRDWPLGQCINGHSDAEHWRPKTGRTRGHCTVCQEDARKRWAEANADRRRETQRRYRETNREQVRENQRQYRERKRSA